MLWNIRGFIFEDHLSWGWHVTRSVDHMTKDLTYYFKPIPKCNFDLSKIPRSIPQAIIKAVQKEVDGVLAEKILQLQMVKEVSTWRFQELIRPWLENTQIITESLLQYDISSRLANSETSKNLVFEAGETNILEPTSTWSKNPESDLEVQLKLRNCQRSVVEDHSYSVKKWKEKCSALLKPAGNWVLLSVQKL